VTESLQPGDRVDHFDVIRLLGQGAQSRVYLARDTKLGRLIALKLLRREGLVIAEEAQLLAQLDHPALVRLWQTGTFSGSPYLALEYIDGLTLRKVLDHRQLDRQEALHLVHSIAGALAVAHAVGIVHRDVKPENILKPLSGSARLIDLGLARLTGIADRSEAIDGTACYLAPEGFAPGSSGAALDQFALGVVLFECLTGRRPYPRTSLEIDPSGLNRAVREAALGPIIEPLVLGLLSTEPAARPAMPAVVRELERAQHQSFAATGLARPYRGLEPYLPEHAALFFGRDEEITTLGARLAEHPFVAVVGPSGIGKSSLVLAGLVPRAEAEGALPPLVIRPGADPFRALASRMIENSSVSLVSRAAPATPHGDAEALASQLAATPHRAAELLRERAAHHGRPVLVVVDQAEELFTLTPVEHRATFAAALLALVDEGVRVVLTIRDDFLGRIAELPPLAQRVERHLFLLRTPPPSALRDFLERALEPFGCAFEDARLVDEMLASVRGLPAALPLMQFAADQLWQVRDRERGLLTRAAFEAMGGVAGALADHAQLVLQAMPTDVARSAQRVLLRLVTPEGSRDVASIDELTRDLGPAASEATHRLIEARLLHVRRDVDGRDVVEFSHEALIATWGTLRRWRDEGQSDTELERFLRSAATRWSRSGGAAIDRLRGRSLDEALGWRARTQGPVGPEIEAFLAASEDGERQRERFRRRLRIAVRGTVAFVLAVSLFATVLVLQQAHRARQSKEDATQALALALVEGAESADAREQPIEAATKLRASLEIRDSARGRALWDKLMQTPLKLHVTGDQMFYAVTFLPDGNVVTGGSSGVLSSIDRTTGEETRWPLGVLVGIMDFAVPDEQHVIAAGGDGRVLSLDRSTGGIESLFALPNTLARRVAVSPNRRLLAAAYSNGAILLYDRVSHSVRQLGRHPMSAVGVAFRTDDELYSAGDDGARSWQVASGRSTPIAALVGPISAFAYDQKLGLAAAGRFDGRIELWNASSGEHHTLFGHGGEVKALAFDAPHRLLASGAWDDGLRIWRIARGDSTVIAGHTDGIYGLAFDANTGLLASAATDRSIRVVDPELAIAMQPTRHLDRIHGISFSNDGELIASVSADHTVRLWHRATGVSRRLTYSPSSIGDVVFDPVAPVIYTSAKDGSLRQVDIATGDERNLVSPGSHVTDFAVSADWFASIIDERIEVRRRGDSIATPLSHQLEPAQAITLSVHGPHLVSIGTGGQLRWWNLNTGEQTLLSPRIDRPKSVAVNAAETWVAVGAGDGMVHLVSVAEPHRSYTLAARAANVWGVHFSLDGRMLLAVGDDVPVSRWLTQDLGHPPEPLKPLQMPGRASGAITLNVGPHGEVVASCDQDTLRVWQSDGTPLWHALPTLPLAPTCVYRPELTGVQEASAKLAGLMPAGPDNSCDKGALSSALRACASVSRDATRVSPDGRHIALSCLGGIEVFEMPAQRRALHAPAADAFALTNDGLVTLVGHELAYMPIDPSKEFARHVLLTTVDAVGAGDSLIAAVQGSSVIELDATGRSVHRTSLEGVTAIAFDRGAWILGTRDGGVVVWSPDSDARRTLVSSGTASVTALAAQGELLAIGHEDGAAAIVSLTENQLLWSGRLHGAIASLDLERDTLMIGSELADTRRISLTRFRADWCAILHEIVDRFGAVWVSGRPERRGLPEHHPCR
jgi:serine/threonine protein kinase/WD40 repeat protein